MANSKEIIRLHERGSTQREIASIQRCNLKTVSKTLKAAKAKQLGYAELAKVDDVTVRQLLFDPPEQVSIRISSPCVMSFLNTTSEVGLSRPGVSLPFISSLPLSFDADIFRHHDRAL